MNITRRVTETVDFEYMKAAIDAGNGPEFVRPFDELIIPLENGKSITAVCGGYVGDRRTRFVLKDCLPELHVTSRARGGGTSSRTFSRFSRRGSGTL